MRTRYVYRSGQLVEKKSAPPRGGFILSDIQPFTTQDGTHITSRSALRAYEEVNGVRQCGNDWTGPEKPSFWDNLMEKRNGR